MCVSKTDACRLVRRYCFLPLLGLAVLTIAGCSGGDSSTSPSKSGTSKPAKTAETPKAEPAEEEQMEAPAVPDSSDTPATADTAEPPEAKPETPPADVKPAEPTESGRFSGTIVLDGEAPELAPLVKAGDENVKDKEVCGVGVPDQSLLVGEGNGIANVFVYLRRAPKGYKSESPTETIELDQKGCVFVPHTALIRAGQKVLVKSSDPIQHNVHTNPNRNQATNLLIEPNDQEGLELTYRQAENDPFLVKCDIHAWMSSFHLVLDHPFMAVTDANGKFSIDGLPDGDYEFRIWHERGDVLDKAYKVSVPAAPVTVKFPLEKFPAKG